MLSGEADRICDAVYAHFRDTQRMIRTEDWKYVVYPQVGREQLFHLTDDPDELHNLAGNATARGIQVTLSTQLDHWRAERDDPTLSQ